MRRPFDGAVVITTEYGESEPGTRRGYHTGVDYAMNQGTPVLSPTSGTLHENGDGTASTDGRGYFVTIVGDDGVGHCLYHLKQRGTVAVGSHVSEGQVVGYSGNTGFSTGPHLHWETRRGVDNNTSDFPPADWLFAGQSTGTPVTSAPAQQTATKSYVRLFGDYRTVRSTPGGAAKGKIAPNTVGTDGHLDYEILDRAANSVKISTRDFGQGWVTVSGDGTDALTQYYNA